MLPNPKSFQLPQPLAYSANCSTPYGIICVGGENASGITNQVILLKCSDDTVSCAQLPRLPIPLTNAATVFAEGVLFVAGGETVAATGDWFFKLDLKSPEKGWVSLPPVPRPVSHAVMMVLKNPHSNKIYLAGGRRKNENRISEFYASMFEFDLQKNKWLQKKDMPEALSAGTGAAAGNHQLLILGGDNGATFHKVEALIKAIQLEKDSLNRETLNRQKMSIQSSHPGFTNKVLLYDARTDSWSTLNDIPFPVPVTTTAILKDNSIIIPSGEIRAGVRTAQILEGIITYKK